MCDTASSSAVPVALPTPPDPAFTQGSPSLPPPFPGLPIMVNPPLGFPPPPPGFPTAPMPPPPHGFTLAVPPPPPGFPTGSLPPPPPGFHQYMPSPPPGFFPRHRQAPPMQDPLSSIPHQTFQAHRANHNIPPPSPHPSLPPKPSQPTRTASAAELAAATVSAAPELRDFKKEATAFMPSSLKRKKVGGATAGSSRVNAAPSLGPGSGDSQTEVVIDPAKPDLLNTLKDQFGLVPPVPSPTTRASTTASAKGEPKGKDDYAKFVEEMGDILGPSE